MSEHRVGQAAGEVVGARVLGQVCLLTADGGVVAVPSATQRRLLAMLALRRGRPVRPERLGEDMGLSAGALRKAISRLRALTGGAALRTEPVGYTLDLVVDAERFAAAVAADATAVDREAVLAAALELWHGDALDEFAAEAWAQGEATRLEELRNGAAEERAALLLSAGRFAAAVADLELQVARRPFADRPRLLLMCALAGDGRPTEALRSYQAHRLHLAEAVGTEPSEELRDVERRIAQGWDGRPSTGVGDGTPRPRPTTRRPRPGGALPRATTRWFGPTATITAAADHLVAGGVVTLTGPGGVGKTRTATEAAGAVADRFPDGVHYVELSAVADADQVAEAVASTVGATRQPGLTTLASLVDRLRGRRALLVLDDCEHVTVAAAEVAAALVEAGPTIGVLVTSREVLGVPGETVLAVPSLGREDGVELFTDRARAADAPRRLSDDDRSVVAQICEHLDGIPLALELAAARTATIDRADLLRRLGDRLDLLVGPRDAHDHRRTLRATVDWSYDLLDDGEQVLFERLSVFAGSFDRAAAEGVCSGAPLADGDVGRGLDALAARSMVAVDNGPDGERYRLLETLRHHGEERLARRRQTAALGFRHLEHYVAVAEAAGATWLSPDQVAADAVFDREWANLRAAHSFACATRQVRHLERLLVASIAHSQLRMRTEHGTWCRAAVAAAGPEPLPPAVVGWAAWWSMVDGDHVTSERLCRAAITAAADRPSAGAAVDTGLALCLSVAAFNAWSDGRRDEAGPDVAALRSMIDDLPPWPAYTAVRALFSFSVGAQWEVEADRIAAICEGIGAPALVASARFYQATAKLYAGPAPDGVAAAGLHAEGIALARSVGADFSEGQHLQGLLDATVSLDSPDAPLVCVEALTRLRDLGYWLYQWRVLDSAAYLLARTGCGDQAATVLGHLDAHAPPWRSQPRGMTRDLLVDHPNGAALTAAGASLDRDEVVALAISTLASADQVAPLLAG